MDAELVASQEGLSSMKLVTSPFPKLERCMYKYLTPLYFEVTY
jgi:hypothetical protein